MSNSSNRASIRASIRAGKRAPHLRHASTVRTLTISIAAGVALCLPPTARAEVLLDHGTPDLNVAAASLNVTAPVGVNTAAVGLNTAAVGITEKDKSPRPRPQPASSLRCWQFGRLLFEENNLEPAPDTLASARAWARTRPGDPANTSRTTNGAVHLLQLGDAICLFTNKEKDG